MKHLHRLSVLLLAAVLLLAGCAQSLERLNREPGFGPVRVLGVLPILVDPESRIDHPRAEEVVSLLRERSRSQEERLVAALQKSGRFFDVRPVAGDGGALFRGLVEAGAWRGEGTPFREYRFRTQAVKELAGRSATDGLLVVVLQGSERLEKRWDRTRITYLEGTFNLIQATVALLDGEGRLLWQAPVPGDAFLPLQYPDFSAAYYNRSDQVPIRFLTLEGLGRLLAEEERTLLGRPAGLAVYSDLTAAVLEALREAPPLEPSGGGAG